MSGRLPSEWFADLKEIVRFEEPLARHTSFGIGGPAACFAVPRSVAEVEGLLEVCDRRSLPWRMLAGGTNVLVSDRGVDGLVIHLSRQGFARVEPHEDHVLCGAAVPLPKLVKAACRDWADPSFAALAGIPGTLAGAVRMNAGGKHGAIGPLVKSVRVVSPSRGPQWLPASELRFGYRTSNLAGAVVIEVDLALDMAADANAMQRHDQILSEKRRTQPRAERSAGCVFVNPRGPDGRSVSAGRLIDDAGLKNCAVGGAAVSDVHANFIVNRGSATAADVLSLIELVRAKVKAVHGLDLSLEIEVW